MMKSDKVNFLLIAVFILLQLPFLFLPINEPHAHRQADTASVSKNFADESANIFYPRIDMRGDLSAITGMEFPLY